MPSVSSWHITDITRCQTDVRFSNRPVGVNCFQTIRLYSGPMSRAGSCFSTESAHRPFHHGIRERGGTIFWAALPLAGPSDRANSPHPSSREGHHSTAGVELELPPIAIDAGVSCCRYGL